MNSAAHCYRCGAGFRPNWKFCGKCRAPLVSQDQQIYPATRTSTTTPPPRAPIANSQPVSLPQAVTPAISNLSPSQFVQCPACHNYIEDDGDFCEHCGARVSATAEAARIAQGQAARERAALEEAQRQQAARERDERERIERERAAQERLVRERAAREKAERERIEHERIAREKAEQERLALEQAEQNRRRIEQAKQEQAATEQFEERRTQISAAPSQATHRESEFVPAAATVANESLASSSQASSFVSAEESTNEFFLPVRSQWAASTGRRTIIIVSALVLLLIGGIALVLFTTRSKEQASASTSGNPKGSADPVKQPAPVAPDGMIYVPGGTFKMGRDDGVQDERPAHEVKLKPFFIDRYEVTCEQYQKFIEATGHRAPKTWTNGKYPQGGAHWPVTGVTWSDATAYANWVGKRLPTEEEWEMAARGTDGRLYPWGNKWQQSSDTNASANAFNTSVGHLVDVGTFKAASPFGAYDMVGNAWEWTASDWAAYPGGTLTKAPAYPDMKVMRGNYWGADDQHATTTFRIGWPANATDPNVSYKNAGFRCAKDAPA